ncbi:cell division protein FtsL [Oceanobacillus polygoni]|uniref:Cell division protein FtsL n=1 Tax=Oceanobacillus polygoni TaxID=1235259 RepID=A0A9X1CJ79_9BACI|nr:cell division protein FtsL [Oceanobacillus polygoni]
MKGWKHKNKLHRQKNKPRRDFLVGYLKRGGKITEWFMFAVTVIYALLTFFIWIANKKSVECHKQIMRIG